MVIARGRYFTQGVTTDKSPYDFLKEQVDYLKLEVARDFVYDQHKKLLKDDLDAFKIKLKAVTVKDCPPVKIDIAFNDVPNELPPNDKAAFILVSAKC